MKSIRSVRPASRPYVLRFMSRIVALGASAPALRATVPGARRFFTGIDSPACAGSVLGLVLARCWLALRRGRLLGLAAGRQGRRRRRPGRRQDAGAGVAPPCKGDAVAGKAVFTGTSGCAGCHTFTAAGATGTVGPNLDKLAEYAQTAGQPLAAFVSTVDHRPGRVRRAGLPDRRHADVLRDAPAAAARRPRRLPDAEPADLSLPADFPRDVAVVATDLDHTLIWQDGALRPRTLAVLDAGARERACT